MSKPEYFESKKEEKRSHLKDIREESSTLSFFEVKRNRNKYAERKRKDKLAAENAKYRDISFLPGAKTANFIDQPGSSTDHSHQFVPENTDQRRSTPTSEAMEHQPNNTVHMQPGIEMTTSTPLPKDKAVVIKQSIDIFKIERLKAIAKHSDKEDQYGSIEDENILTDYVKPTKIKKPRKEEPKAFRTIIIDDESTSSQRAQSQVSLSTDRKSSISLKKYNPKLSQILQKKLKYDTSSFLPKFLDKPKDCKHIDDGPKVDFIYLPSPIKSESDTKNYRVVKFSNGLTVCLISDLQNYNPELFKEDFGEDYNSDSDEDESVGEESLEEEEELNFPSSDMDMTDRKRKVFDEVAENKMAAAALCINVGSFADPPEVLGLAHFLEHMIFMGSRKYPKENGFDSYISSRGGSDNASTDVEHTTFHFECLEKHLYVALDRFAHCITQPLLNISSMRREKEAIDSEFHQAMPNDDYRIEQLLMTMFKKNCPINTFLWGNLQTLSTDQKSNEDLQEKLRKFKNNFYTPNRMCLAIQARLPLDYLQVIAMNTFGCMKGKENEVIFRYQKPKAGLSGPNIFNPRLFNKIYYVKPVKDNIQLQITWVLPSLLSQYKSKPHHYLGSLIGHEGTGSLMSFLRKKVWGLTIVAGCEDSGLEHNSLFSLFQISITLTREGFNNLEEVICAVFSYLNMLKREDPSEAYFRELQHISDTAYKYQEEDTAVENVEEMCENMHLYPSEDYMRGPLLYMEYDEAAIKDLLSKMIPETMNIIVMTSIPPKAMVFKNTEKWFETKYIATEIEAEFINTLNYVDPHPDFKFPQPNTFITSDFTIVEKVPPEDIRMKNYPRKLNTPEVCCEVWYKADLKYLLPIAFFYIYIIAPKVTETTENACMADIFVSILQLHLQEVAYPALVAALHYSVTVGDNGFVIKVNGYNQNLPNLLYLIGSYINNFSKHVTESEFNVVKYKLVRSYYNKFIKVGQLARDMRLKVLVPSYHTLLVKHEAISAITYGRFLDYSGLLLDKVFIEILVQGNITETQALATSMKFYKLLDCFYTFRAPIMQVNQLPVGEHCLRMKSLNRLDPNSIVTNYYQIGPYTEKNAVLVELLMMLLDEPFFDKIRTKENLGYQAFCTYRDTFGVLGFTLTVVSQEDKFPIDVVESRVTNFLESVNQILSKLTKKEYARYIEDLKKVKSLGDTQLKDEVERNWQEIIMQDFIFNRTTKEIIALGELKLSDLKKFWDIYMATDHYRLLSIQVVGNPKSNRSLSPSTSKSPAKGARGGKKSSIMSEDTVSSPYTERYISHIFKLDLLGSKEDCWSENKLEDYFILNLDVFTSNLMHFPPFKKC